MSGNSNQIVVIAPDRANVGPSRPIDEDEFAEQVGTLEPELFAVSRNNWLPHYLERLCAVVGVAGISCLYVPGGWVLSGVELRQAGDALGALLSRIRTEPGLLVSAAYGSKEDAANVVAALPDSPDAALMALESSMNWDEGQGIDVLAHFINACFHLVNAARERDSALLVLVSVCG